MDTEATSTPTAITRDFNNLTEKLTAAVSKFQGDQTPENFAGIVTALGDFGLTGADVWTKLADYTKKNPVRMAAGAAILFFAMKGLIGEAGKRAAAVEYH